MTKLFLSLLAGLILVAGCSRIAKNSQTSQNTANDAAGTSAQLQPAVLDPSEVTELAKFDYAAGLKGAKSYQNYKEHLGTSLFYGMKTDYDTLSPKERLLIDGWNLSSGDFGSDIIATLFRINDFTETYSRMPHSGAELALRIIHVYGLTFDEFKALPVDQQLNKIGGAVNPITGRFFTSFTAPEWQLGAMTFSMIPSRQELLALLPADKVKDFQPTGEFKEGWRVIVYGERPGRILMDRPYETIYPPNDISELTQPQ